MTYLKISLIIIHTIICSISAIIFSIIDRSQSLYFKLSKFFSGGILFFGGVKLKVSGLENLDKNAAYIFVSNHSSQFDIPTLQYAIPMKTSIVYKKELNKIPLFGWQMMLGPYIAVDRKNIESAAQSIEISKKYMSENKWSIILFAEGTRSKDGEVQPFKRGAFYLASRVGFPIVPVSISGAQKILPKGKFKLKGGTIHVHFEKPIITGNVSSRKDELELMEKVREIVIQNIEKGD